MSVIQRSSHSASLSASALVWNACQSSCELLQVFEFIAEPLLHIRNSGELLAGMTEGLLNQKLESHDLLPVRTGD